MGTSSVMSMKYRTEGKAIVGKAIVQCQAEPVAAFLDSPFKVRNLIHCISQRRGVVDQQHTSLSRRMLLESTQDDVRYN